MRTLICWPIPVSYTHLEADLKSTGEVSQGTKEAAQAQGFIIVGDGTLEQAEAPQEAAYRLESGDYLYIQTSETGYDYTLYGPEYKELDGGQLDNPDLSLEEAGKEILAIHERVKYRLQMDSADISKLNPGKLPEMHRNNVFIHLAGVKFLLRFIDL